MAENPRCRVAASPMRRRILEGMSSEDVPNVWINPKNRRNDRQKAQTSEPAESPPGLLLIDQHACYAGASGRAAPRVLRCSMLR